MEMNEYIKQQMEKPKEPFVPGITRLPLQVPSYGWEEVAEALDSLMSQNITMGKKVRAFEDQFARYIGTRHGVMVNSGSSGNLLALSVLSNPVVPNHLKPGDEVITPAVTWATTIYPIVQAGAVPVLVDVGEDLNMLPSAAEAAVTARTRALMPVHLLGNPCDMSAFADLSQRKKLFLIEDTCESHGAMIGNKKTGSFGTCSVFSFFFSHHISTMEGGMVMTNDDTLEHLLRSAREFGWIRHFPDQDNIAAAYPDLDKRFLFLHAGYNVRPLEVEGAFGLRQLPKLEGFIDIRRKNAAEWSKTLSEYGDCFHVQQERPGTRHVWYAYPVVVRDGAPFTKAQLIAFLESKRIETRPIMSGDMTRHPVMKQLRHRVAGTLKNTALIHKNGFFFGNHQGIGPEEREYISQCLHEFMSSVKK